jgi:ubiquinone/menaquinone biosynthesis C-methylase UbiE
LAENWILAAPRWIRHRIGSFPYPHWASVLLDNPIRRALENPAATIDAIGLSGTEKVLELGPGPGFFSAELASRLTTGHLDLFDIQAEMLEKARHKLELAGYFNAGFHVGTAGEDFPFPDDTFDVAFLAEVIGEVPDQPACLRSLARVLKPHGMLVFREAFPDPDRLSVSELRALAEPNGFAFIDGDENRWRGIARFRRKPPELAETLEH